MFIYNIVHRPKSYKVMATPAERVSVSETGIPTYKSTGPVQTVGVFETYEWASRVVGLLYDDQEKNSA